MEFRIAPFILSVLILLFNVFCIYQTQKYDSPIFDKKTTIYIFEIIGIILSISTFIRHDYFKKKEKIFFWTVTVINVFSGIYIFNIFLNS